jgi:hypothetical protein
MWHSGGDKRGHLIFLMTQSGVMTEKTFNFLVTSYHFFSAYKTTEKYYLIFFSE